MSASVSREDLELLVSDIDDAVDEGSRWDGESVIVTHSLLLRVHGAVQLLRDYIQVVNVARFVAPVTQLEDPDEIAGAQAEAFGLARDRWERDYVVGLLEQHQGNISAAARTAGVDRVTIHRLIRKHGLQAACEESRTAEAMRR